MHFCSLICFMSLGLNLHIYLLIILSPRAVLIHSIEKIERVLMAYVLNITRWNGRYTVSREGSWGKLFFKKVFFSDLMTLSVKKNIEKQLANRWSRRNFLVYQSATCSESELFGSIECVHSGLIIENAHLPT